MIQSSRIGKRRMVVPLDLDTMWTDPTLVHYLSRFRKMVPHPSARPCKPQNFNVLCDSVNSSAELTTRGAKDFSIRLLEQLGPDVIKTIYYGLLVGNNQDRDSMVKLASPETVEIDGYILPAVYVLAAHVIAVSLLEQPNKASNLALRSMVRTTLRRFVASTGAILHAYSVSVRKSLDQPDNPLMNRGYQTGDYIVYYVAQETYDDMVIEIRPAPLMESDAAERAISRLSTKVKPVHSLSSQQPANDDRHRQRHSSHSAA